MTNGDFVVQANELYRVAMSVSVAGSVEGDPVGAVSAAASADPQILINPDTPNASQYTLAFSPGVGDGAINSVPEPST
jgi:hypothetical protein